MVLRRPRRRRGDYGVYAGGSPISHSTPEAVAFIHLSDVGRKHQCSPEFVNDLCDRVMNPALEELDRCFGGERWAREIAPSIILEGPALAFKITVTKTEGRELTGMITRINEVFNKHWELEIDRVPPR
jgi:hypothetical protein